MGRLALACALAVTASGCGNLRAIHHGTTLAGGQHGYFIDAQQRAILSSDALDASDVPVSCAEPSPDAMSALSAAASGNLEREDLGQLQASFAMSESAASIGLRTPTIQLLRDGMYRLCEGYMNGALGDNDYLVLINRYQEMMVGLVAIEQLTSTVRASAVTIGGGEASAEAASNVLADARRDRELYSERARETSRRAAELQRQVFAEDNAVSANARDAEVQRLNDENKIWTEALDRQTQLIDDLSRRLTPERTAAAEARSGDGEHQEDSEQAEHPTTEVAAAVQHITDRITQNNFLTMTCGPILTARATQIGGQINGNSRGAQVEFGEDLAYCRQLVRALVLQDLADRLAALNPSPEDLEVLGRALEPLAAEQIITP